MYKYFLLPAFLFFVLITNAQFSVGIRQNISNHGCYFEPPSVQQFQTNYVRASTGLVITYINMNNAGIQAEINFAQKGWKEIDDSTAGSYFTRNINYIEIPVLTHFEIGKGKVRPVILAGPYFAIKIGESSDSENFSRLFTLNQYYNHYEQKIRAIDIGIKAGLGLRYNINSRFGVYAEGIYNIDLAGGTDVFIDQPNGIQASRLKEIGGTIGFLWHLIPQKQPKEFDGYTPKEDL